MVLRNKKILSVRQVFIFTHGLIELLRVYFYCHGYARSVGLVYADTVESVVPEWEKLKAYAKNYRPILAHHISLGLI